LLLSDFNIAALDSGFSIESKQECWDSFREFGQSRTVHFFSVKYLQLIEHIFTALRVSLAKLHPSRVPPKLSDWNGP